MWQLLEQCVKAAMQYCRISHCYRSRVPDVFHRVDGYQCIFTLLTCTQHITASLRQPLSHQLQLISVVLYAFVQNALFGNNSGKSKPIATKFYRETKGHVTRSSGNFWRHLPNWCKKRRKTTFCELFLWRKQRIVSPTQNPAVDFREIWTQNASH